jgi:hypothetical protein
MLPVDPEDTDIHPIPVGLVVDVQRPGVAVVDTPPMLTPAGPGHRVPGTRRRRSR